MIQHMSIFLERPSTDTHTIQRPQFIHGINSCRRSPDSDTIAGIRKIPVEKFVKYSDSDSSSSIGRNSDVSGESSSDHGDDVDENEVQSAFKGPLDTMDALEDVLPIRRGISKHYSGKSKSFTSLSDAVSSPSIKDIAKPLNPHNKKRKPEIPYCKISNKSYNHPPKSINNTGFVLKMFVNNSNQSTLPPPHVCLPPLHPQNKMPVTNSPLFTPPKQNDLTWRSFSLSDLQCVSP